MSSMRKFIDQKEDEYDSLSRDRLLKISQTKIRTTMIGALEVIENQFLQLCGKDSSLEEKERQFFLNMYNQIRTDILDKGNTQIKNLEKEFKNYNIRLLRYHLDLPVKTLDVNTLRKGE